jgi:hypothetical protein
MTDLAHSSGTHTRQGRSRPERRAAHDAGPVSSAIHCGRPVNSGSDVLGGQWQCSVEVLRTDRYRVAYPILVPPRNLIVKPSSACLSAMSMSS